MMFTPHSQYALRNTPLWPSIYIFGGVLLLILAFTTLRLEIEPFWVLCALPVTLLVAILVQEFPVFLMVALVYVGMFKDHAAQSITLTDPTVVTAVLLYTGLILQVLLLASGAGGRNLRDMFAGQMGGVGALCLLVLIIAISYSYTPAPEIGRETVLRLIAFDVPILFAPLILLRTDRDVRQLIFVSIAGGLILAGRTILRVLHPTADILRGESDPTQIGEGLLMAAALLMGLFYSYRGKRLLQAALMGCLVALSCGIMASLSRSAIVAFLAVVFLSLIFLRGYPTLLSRKALLLTAAVVVVCVSLVAGLLWHSPATHAKFAHKLTELNLTADGITHPAGTAGERYSFWQSAWHAFLAKPLLGWGTGGWSTLWHYSDERILKYPHNFVLEIAAEQGLVGLAALGLLLLGILRACGVVLHERQSRFVFIVPVVVLTIVGNAVSGQVETRDLWFWCGTLFALARMSQASWETVARR